MNDLNHLIGKEVLISRGSRGVSVGPARERDVRCMLIAVQGPMVHATLLEDDPVAELGPRKCGHIIRHGHSFVRPLKVGGPTSQHGGKKHE